jgi:hypothetical protein
MNPTLSMEPLNRTFPSPDAERHFSSSGTTFESIAEPGRKAVPVWWSLWKFEERIETFVALLSVVYLIGAIGFGGLLLFDALNR